MNLGTGLVLGILIFVVVGVIFSLRRSKGTCGCGCSKCPSSGICHKGE